MNPSTMIFTDIAFPAVLLIALALVGFLVFGAFSWRQSTDALRARLTDGGGVPRDDLVGADHLDELPAPVARYLRFALTEGRGAVACARLTSEGEFRRGEAADAWIDFRADQLFSTARPGFVWDARMRIAPGVGIRVLDAYVDGAGTMKAAVAGLITVVDAPNTLLLAAGELARWLAETPWFPMALLPGGAVEWTPIDETSARATVRDGQVTASAEFRFGVGGEVEEVFVADRPRDVDGTFVPTPWSGRFKSYEEQDGVRIPREAVVQWHLSGGELPYWRGRITGAVYALV